MSFLCNMPGLKKSVLLPWLVYTPHNMLEDEYPLDVEAHQPAQNFPRLAPCAFPGLVQRLGCVVTCITYGNELFLWSRKHYNSSHIVWLGIPRNLRLV